MIKELIEKFLCKHEWNLEAADNVYGEFDSPERGDLPIKRIRMFCCKKCGKFKKISL